MVRLFATVLILLLVSLRAIAGGKAPKYPPTVAIYIYERPAPAKEFVKTVLLELSQIMEQYMVCDAETENYIYKVFIGVLGHGEKHPYLHYSIVEIPKNNLDGGVKEFYGSHGLPLPGVKDRVLHHFAQVLSSGRVFWKITLTYLRDDIDHEIIGAFYRGYDQLICKASTN